MNASQSTAFSRRLLGCAASGLILIVSQARGQSLVQVSTGYYDLPPGNGGSNLALPSPWVGSSNTVFYGNTSVATSSDPDENAILLQNLGSSPVTLTALNIGSTIDLFSASYDNITGPVTLNPGMSYIFAGVDGSDVAFTDVVNLTVNGQSYSYNDAVNATYYPSGVLVGFPVSTDETVPWTVINSAVPEPASDALLLGVAAAGIVAWRRRFNAS